MTTSQSESTANRHLLKENPAMAGPDPLPTTDDTSPIEPESNIADLASVDPFDPANFAAPPDAEMVVAQRELVTCRVGKPPRDSFCRAHIDMEMSVEAFLLTLESQGEVFLLTPRAAKGIPELAKRVRLTRAITRQGDEFLWVTNPVPVHGRDNPYWISNRKALEMAKSRWVRMQSNQAVKAYDVFTASADIPDPTWSNYALADLLRAGFGENRINDPQHPVIRRILGRA